MVPRVCDFMISFVVPAYNEELELPATLASIKRAAEDAAQGFEIVVADDASTDRTPEIAAALGARVVHINRRQIAAARNAGAAAARGDILFFVDADTRINTAHVVEALALLRNGCAGGGARMAPDGHIPPWARVGVGIFSAIYFGANLGAGAFLFTTRANFERAGGFDEQYFAGEEFYFTQAMKKLGRFRLLKEPVLTSGRKLRMHSAGRIFQQCVRIGLSGRRAVRSRQRLNLWYDGQREHATPPQTGG